MSRKRYISTEISISGKIEELARRAGEYAVVLFTWMIPHVDDWGRMEGEADKVFFTVTPRFALLGRTPEDAEKALRAMADLGLIERYEVAGKFYIQVNLNTFYELQTYIPKEKRAEDKSAFPAPPPKINTESQKVAQNSTEQQQVAQNTPSPSSSPVPSPKEKEGSTSDSTTYEDVPPPPEKESLASPISSSPELKSTLDKAVKAYYSKWPEERKKFKVGGVVTTRKVFEQALTGADGDDPVEPGRLMQQIENWPEIVTATPWDIVKACRAGPWEKSWADINSSINEFLEKEREAHANPRDAP